MFSLAGNEYTTKLKAGIGQYLIIDSPVIGWKNETNIPK